MTAKEDAFSNWLRRVSADVVGPHPEDILHMLVPTFDAGWDAGERAREAEGEQVAPAAATRERLRSFVIEAAGRLLKSAAGTEPWGELTDAFERLDAHEEGKKPEGVASSGTDPARTLQLELLRHRHHITDDDAERLWAALSPRLEASVARFGWHSKFPAHPPKELARLRAEVERLTQNLEGASKTTGHQSDVAERLRGEVERLRAELVLAIDESEHGHNCSFCGCDLTGPPPWAHSKDCMVVSMRDALAREDGAP